MGVAVDGIVSGLDTTAIIDAIVGVYEVPKQTLEDRIEDLEETKEALASLNAKIESFSSSLAAIDTVDEFRSYTSTTDADEFEISLDSDAIPGTYRIEVSELATNAVVATDDTYSSISDASLIEDGDWSVNLAGNVTFITIDSTMTLNDVVSEINENVDGVTAYILDTDGGSNFRLVISADDTGADNTLIAKGPTTATGFSDVRTAQNAELTIDGMDITSASNTLTEIIPGLDLTLREQTTTAQTVTIELDVDSMMEKAQTVVDAYNEVVSYIDTQTVYNTDVDIRGDLLGESVVRRLQTTLRSAVSAAYDGLEGDLNSLSLIGIRTNASGRMELDEDDFTDALSENQSDVEDMFTSDDGFGTQLISALDLYIDPYDGSIQSREESIDEVIANFEAKVEDWEGRIERYEERLRSQFAALESFLSYAESTQSYLATLFDTSND